MDHGHGTITANSAAVVDSAKKVDEWNVDNITLNGKNIKELPPYILQHDYYFFMGDNRDSSYDSRFWGFVPDYHILGTPLLSLINIFKFKLRLKVVS